MLKKLISVNFVNTRPSQHIMWPFKTKDLGLINDGWLKEQRIPREYRSAFNWSSSKIRSEIKRNTKLASDNERDVQELVDERRSHKLEYDQVIETFKMASKANKEGEKNAQDIKKIEARRRLVYGKIDELDKGIEAKRSLVASNKSVVKMLKRIKSKRYTTPEQ